MFAKVRLPSFSVPPHGGGLPTDRQTDRQGGTYHSTTPDSGIVTAYHSLKHSDVLAEVVSSPPLVEHHGQEGLPGGGQHTQREVSR